MPIVPGIMSIGNYGGFKRMIKFCKTRVTAELEERMEALKDDVEGGFMFADCDCMMRL